MNHDDEHERILQAVLVGDLDRDDETVRLHLAGCEPCRRRLERLSGMAQRLDEMAREETSALAEARRADGEPDPALDPVIRRLRREQGRRPPWRWLAAAAVLLLVSLAAYRWLPSRPPRADVPMGVTNEVELEAPVGRVHGSSYGVFRWKYELPPRGYFLLEVADDTPGGQGTIVVRQKRLDQNRWDPASEEPAVELPARIRWTVTAYGLGDGPPLGSGEARAELSSD